MSPSYRSQYISDMPFQAAWGHARGGQRGFDGFFDDLFPKTANLLQTHDLPTTIGAYPTSAVVPRGSITTVAQARDYAAAGYKVCKPKRGTLLAGGADTWSLAADRYMTAFNWSMEAGYTVTQLKTQLLLADMTVDTANKQQAAKNATQGKAAPPPVSLAPNALPVPNQPGVGGGGFSTLLSGIGLGGNMGGLALAIAGFFIAKRFMKGGKKRTRRKGRARRGKSRRRPVRRTRRTRRTRRRR